MGATGGGGVATISLRNATEREKGMERERGTLQEIQDLWRVHRDAGWPPCAGGSEGELMTLDTVISGCVAYFLEQEHGLDPQRVVILEDCLADL
ncbi:MAG: hypothetical protein ACREI3_12920, partial [Nitrospirales bacterium]